MKTKNKISKKLKKIIPVVLLLPQFVHARGAWCTPTDCSFKQFVKYVTETLSRPVMTLLVSLTVVWFLMGIAQFMGSAGDANKRQDGRKKMFSGVIAIAILMSFWGLAKILKGTFFV